MAYLQAVGKAFAYIQKLAGLPVKFQVGEPWWWIMPDGRICLYDAAAVAEFGALAVSIPDIRGAKSAAQNAMLDKHIVEYSGSERCNAVRRNIGIGTGYAQIGGNRSIHPENYRN